MDLVRLFFSLTIDPHDWLESLATFAVIMLIAGTVFMIGWFGVCGRARREAFTPLAAGLVIAIMNYAGQIGWFRDTSVAAGRAGGLWFCAASITLLAIFLLIAGVRMERGGDTFVGGLMIYTSLLFVSQATFMAMQAWNDQTLADYAACLEGTACDVQSASDELIMMPLWVMVTLLILGVMFLISSLLGLKAKSKDGNSGTAEAEEAPIVSPLAMIASPLIAPKRDQD